MKNISITIHNISILVSTNCDYVLDNLSQDFSFYLDDNGTAKHSVILNAYKGKADYNKIPPLEASLHGLGITCYRDKNVHYIVYENNGLMIYNFPNETGEIYSEDPRLLYEKCRLTILSRTGEILDRRGIHRIHAVGLSKEGRAIICLLPMEGGKTTIALNVLKNDRDANLIADDTCYIDYKGFVHPLILRVGVRDTNLLEGIPSNFITAIDRPRFGRKYLVNPNYFTKQISKKCKISCILIGKRSFKTESEVHPVSKLKCLIPFLQSGVFGLGLSQIIELFLRKNRLDTLRKIRLVFSRAFSFVFLILRTETFEMTAGRDLKDTTTQLVNLMDKVSVPYRSQTL